MRQWSLAIVAFLGALLLAACGGGESEPATPTPSPLQQELDAAAEAWQARSIDAYDVRVTYRHADWHPQILELSVADGTAVIRDQECIPGQNCFIRELDPSEFTIEHIISQAQALAERGAVRSIKYNRDGHPWIIEAEGDNWTISNLRPLDE